jgi:polysaccharide chain length determinant protein (PEP-CTERM system associated)
MNDIMVLVYSYARALWRRRWLAIAVAWAVCSLAWLAVLALPDRYEATARVYVDARTALRPVLEGIAIEEDYDSQLALVREALLSRPQLEAVARATNLDADVTDEAGMEGLITGLQQQISVISTVTQAVPGQQQSSDTIYSISYQHTNRQMSLDVVRTLLDNFVEGTLSGNRTGANEAQSFLVRQIADLEKRLSEAEARLAEFRKRNVGMLPGESRGDYFSRLEAEMTALQLAETNLAVAASRREELRRQLAAARQFVPGTAGSAGATASGAVPDVSIRVQEAEARLEDLLLRFTDRHPEVLALRQTIAELKEREARELAELARGGAGTGAIRSLNVNPVYQSIQTQLSQVDVELASLRGAASQHRREIAELRRFVDSAPEVEQEFARLNRDYTVQRAQYQQLVERLERARVSDDAAQNGIVRFDVIEPPRAGLSPVWPKRSVFMLLALMAGLGAGVVLALVPAVLRPTFDDPNSLSRSTGLPVLGSVSALRPAGHLDFVRLESRKVALACGALVAVGGAMVVFGGAGARLLRSLIA